MNSLLKSIRILPFMLLAAYIQVAAAAGTWVAKAPMPVTRFANVVGGIGNLLYAAGGSNYVCGEYTTLEVYDPVTNLWTSRASMPTARESMGAAVVNGTLYVIGGTSGCSSVDKNNVEAYDPSTNTWSIKSPMPSVRSVFGIGVLGNVIYVVGGMSRAPGLPNPSLATVNTVSAYDTTTNTWVSKAPLPVGRYGMGVGVANGILYAIGGYSSITSLSYSRVDAYNPVTDTWSTVAPLPADRSSIEGGVATLGGMLYVAGGNVASGPTSTALSYTPATNTWTYIEPMPTARVDARVAVVNNVLYSVGGGTSGGPTSVVDAYTPSQPPVASAGADQNIYLGQTALLNGSASSDSNGAPLSYTWTLDMAPVGSTATLSAANTAMPSITPDVAGVYHISLVVNDGQLSSATSTVSINVSLNLPPVAVATANPVSGYAPLQVAFDAGASHDPEGSGLTYSWDFGDPSSGASNVSTMVNPIHTYTSIGNYSAVVTVMDNFGKTDQASVAISITAPNLPPTVAPTANPSNGAAPLSVQFSANATDINMGDVLSYSWDFGDGSPLSILANPQHTYSAGTFTAQVSVSDGINIPVSASLTISAGSALSINVTEAKVERGEKGKVEGKISMQSDFNFVSMPLAGDAILVRFDGITLLNVPFANFHQESAYKFEYESRTQSALIDFNRKTIKVSAHKILTGQIDNSNGIDVIVGFGSAIATDNFVMKNHKGQRGDRESELSHKKEDRH